MKILENHRKSLDLWLPSEPAAAWLPASSHPAASQQPASQQPALRQHDPPPWSCCRARLPCIMHFPAFSLCFSVFRGRAGGDVLLRLHVQIFENPRKSLEIRGNLWLPSKTAAACQPASSHPATIQQPASSQPADSLPAASYSQNNAGARY